MLGNLSGEKNQCESSERYLLTKAFLGLHAFISDKIN